MFAKIENRRGGKMKRDNKTPNTATDSERGDNLSPNMDELNSILKKYRTFELAQELSAYYRQNFGACPSGIALLVKEQYGDLTIRLD